MLKNKGDKKENLQQYVQNLFVIPSNIIPRSFKVPHHHIKG